MQTSDVKKILDEYDRHTDAYAVYCRRVHTLVEELLRANDLAVHSVGSRIKSRESLAAKLAKDGKSYTSLRDITDVAGLRITTYFASDVDRVARVLASEFTVDPVHSIDKRAALDSDRFGYLSLHYVVDLSPDRRRLTEYRSLPEAKVEIQVRSILQHAWAEIEHDLGYKSKAAVPAKIRRRFSRLAGLLELADEEFDGLRRELMRYEQRVATRIATSPASVGVNSASVRAYVRRSERVKRLDAIIADIGRSRLSPRVDRLDVETARLLQLGVKSIAELDTALGEYEGIIGPFAREWMGPREADEGPDGHFNRGVSLFYLAYVLAAVKLDGPELLRFLRRWYVDTDDEAAVWAHQIREAYGGATR